MRGNTIESSRTGAGLGCGIRGMGGLDPARSRWSSCSIARSAQKPIRRRASFECRIGLAAETVTPKRHVISSLKENGPYVRNVHAKKIMYELRELDTSLFSATCC